MWGSFAGAQAKNGGSGSEKYARKEVSLAWYLVHLSELAGERRLGWLRVKSSPLDK